MQKQNPSSKHARQLSRQGGFTLVEILVAMLVLAIGLLGVAAMQLRGLQYSQDSYMRSQVAILASTMADTMRLSGTDGVPYVSNYTSAAAPPAGCVQVTRTPASELACWQLAAHGAMPIGSQASITIVNDEITITLRPYDRTNDALGNPISYSFFL